MPQRIAITRRTLAATLFVITAAGAVQSCTTPTAPPQPPSGGHTLVLDYARFTQEVEPVLMRQGCDADGDCHGGGIRGTLELSPPTAKDPAYDFAQVALQCSTVDPDSSDLLLRPLARAAGGRPHPYQPFADRADTDYVRIRAWIAAGVLR